METLHSLTRWLAELLLALTPKTRRDLVTPRLTLEYWMDQGWYVGRIREVPGVFSQGATLQELEENIRDAYRLMMEDQPAVEQETHLKEIVMA